MKLNVHKRNVDLLMVLTARRMTAAAERIGQKTDKVIASVPLLKRISDKAKAFDAKMTEKHGHVYTKILARLDKKFYFKTLSLCQTEYL